MKTEQQWAGEWPSQLGDRLSFITTIQADAHEGYKSPQEVAAIVEQRDACLTRLGENDEEIKSLRSKLTAHTEALKVAKEALQRVWEDSEMGWVTYVEYPNDKACVECRSLIPAQPHSADCLQSVVHAALATINDLLK